MARPLKPLVHSGGWYPSKKWIPLVRNGGYTTQNGGEQPEPEAVLKTVTGSLIHITDALALPAKALSVNVEPVQDLHGYDHPWPGGGGENLLDPNLKFPTGTQYGLTLTSADGYTFSYTGAATSSGNILSSRVNKADAVILPAGTYISKNGTMSLYKTDGSWLRNQYPGSVFTVDEPFYVGNFYWEIVEGRTYNVNSFLALVKGSTAPTSWSPYSNICPISGRTSATIYRSGADTSNPTTYTIQLGDTVYGGTLDVTEGKMVVDRAIVDLGTKNWGYLSPTSNIPYGLFYAIISGKAKKEKDVICSSYPLSTNDFKQDKSVLGNNAANTVYVIDSSYTDTTTFASAMSGVQLCYELATPIEITLTPTQIEMLLGENNLWSDAGDSTLTYYADGNASDVEALNILLGGRYVNNHGEDEPTDREALDILLGR